MRMRTGLFVTAALVLAGIYVFKFTDWFAEKKIQILYTYRHSKPLFGLEGRAHRLNSVKVYRVAEISTNKYAHPLWHLTSKEGSVPVSEFHYGAPIEGMQPDVPGTAAEPLERKVPYLLVIQSGKVRSERSFQIP